MDVYVIHDGSLEMRKENVEHIKATLQPIEQIREIHIIDTFDHNNINQEEVKKVIRTSKPATQTETDTAFEKFIQPMTINNISNYLKHIHAYETIVKADRPGLIIEDDVIISDEITTLIKQLSATTHNIVFCGQPFTEVPKETFEPIKNFNDMSLLPSCESYYILPQTAAILLKAMLPIVFTTNIAISLCINSNDLAAHKMYPNAFIDGSKIGKFTSHINNNNILMFNKSYNELYQIIQTQEGEIDLDKFNRVFAEAQYKESPDMLYLKGLAYLKARQMIEAKNIFDDVFQSFCDNKCSLNKTSSFMTNYMSFFRMLQ
jgi:GR25 family glycosyltransferase involved in LPS biosynthesis